MSLRDVSLFLLLSAIWGASFLFMRIAAPEFGAVALVTVRAFASASFLLLLFLFKKKWHIIFKHWKLLLIIGITNTVIPFSFLAYTAIYLTAGATSILNACVPIFTAIIGFLWFKKRLSKVAILGIFIGFVGVFIIANKNPEDVRSQTFHWLPVITALIATVSYGIAANLTEKYLQNIDSQASATGSQLFAAILLLPLGYLFWPETTITPISWLCAIALGVLCTAIAYLIFFNIIHRIGATNMVTVTYVVPVFAIIFGYIFLSEIIAFNTIVGALLILIGITLTSGLHKRIFK